MQRYSLGEANYFSAKSPTMSGYLANSSRAVVRLSEFVKELVKRSNVKWDLHSLASLKGEYSNIVYRNAMGKCVIEN